MRQLLLLTLAGGCSWTSFDDLSKQAWAQSTQKPSVGSSNYAVALAGTSPNTAGGQLSVLGTNEVTYSTLVYDTKGGTTVGPSFNLAGAAQIETLTMSPILVSDDVGDCAAVANATPPGGTTTIAAFKGCASQPGSTSLPSALPPDAAAYVGTTLVVAAGPNLYVDMPGGALWCAPGDETNAPVASIAGLGGDDKNVWAWGANGKLYSYALADLMTCALTTAMPAPTSGTMIASRITGVATNYTPATGSSVMVVGNSMSTNRFVVLAGTGASGKVFVVRDDTTVATVGTPLDAANLQAAATGDFGTGTFVALGFPGSSTGGEVELHEINTSTGALNATADKTLADAQPDSGEQFGRALAIMKFNGLNVLAVAAKSEVFAYFRLDPIYPETRQ